MKTLGAILAATLFATAASGQPPLTNADTRARPESFRETLFGQTIEDPYRWMESPGRAADVEAFIRQSSAHTVVQLAALPVAIASATAYRRRSRPACAMAIFKKRAVRSFIGGPILERSSPN